jgi:serine/threonine protein phosphatase PrpC
MACPNCGTQVESTEEFCPECGTPLSENNPDNAVAGDSADGPVLTNEPPPMDPKEAEELKFLTTPKVPINVDSAGFSHVGLHKENNEDEVTVREIEYPLHRISVRVAIVADGMGGEPAGEICGALAVGEAWLAIRFLLPPFDYQHGFSKLEFWQHLNYQLSNHLTAAAAAANTRVFNFGRSKKLKLGGFGATLVMVVGIFDLDSGQVKLYGYNEGDARAGLIIADKFTQLTTDHSVGGKPLRFLGRHEHVSGTAFSWEVWMSEADFTSFSVVLYTDGLWNMLSPAQMTTLNATTDSAEQLCKELVKQALVVEVPHGKTLGDDNVITGDDNLTAAVIRVQLQTKE